MNATLEKRRAPGGGFTSRHEVLTEGRLEEMAQRFARLRIHDFTAARFEEYVRNPAPLEEMTLFLRLEDILVRKGAHPEAEAEQR